MPSPLLTFFKYLFLVVLYLFFLRVLRAVWIELREPKTVEVNGRSAPMPAAAAAAPVHAGAQRLPSAETTSTPIAEPDAPTVFGAAAGAVGSPDHLTITGPPAQAGQRFRLGDELTIGRSPGCAIALPDDTYVSSLHARVFRRNGQYLVEDLGSTNGTFLDDAAVGAAVVLRPGARLKVGQTLLELES